MRYLTPLRKSISAFARHRLGGTLKPAALGVFGRAKCRCGAAILAVVARAFRGTAILAVVARAFSPCSARNTAKSVVRLNTYARLADGFPHYLAGFLMLAALITLVVAAGPLISTTRADESRPDLYVPYKDLAHLIEPQDKAVLMDRAQFDKLLVAAEQNARQADTLELGQVKTAQYAAKVAGEELSLTGKLEVVSIGRGPVAVPLGFAGVGLTAVVLDGAPAPLGYDKDGRLTLIVNDKGAHNLEIAGTTKLTELAGGGMQFGISLPQAVAGLMKLTAAGDLEIHATVPASAASYDKQADATSIELTIGGEDKLTVVLLGNGRQQDDRAILLGESAATVSLTRSHQVLSCLYTVQVLRRGVRELQFRLPPEWTITDVSSPSLVKWSVDTAGQLSTLAVRLGAAKVGATALHIKATALRTGQAWAAPHIILVDAAFQRGYLLLNTDEALGVRGEKTVDVRREEALAAALVPGLVGGATGPLYFHWGDNWSVNLELADVEPKRSIKERQQLVVSPQQVTLTGQFEVTAVERELFDLSFVLRGQAAQWQVKTVLVDNSPTGFEYRIEDRTDRRLLKIELPRPIQREKTANVTIVTQHVPSNWDWPGDAPDRSVTIPLMQSQAETVSGYVSAMAEGDLDVAPQKVPDQLEPVPAGRMASLGMAGGVQHAYSNSAAVDGDIQLLVSRRRPRISAESVGLISVQGREFAVDWRIAYTISRASAKNLYLLVDKSLGEEFKIASATVPITSKSIVQPGEKSVPLSDELAKRYNLYLLNLDHSSLGDVVIDVRYERPIVDKGFDAPLVRPICLGEISEQLAVQAAEESAVKVDVSGAKEIDAVDLPPLPAQAARILWAFRLDAPTTPGGAKTALILNTDVHEGYEIPSALAVSAWLTTYLDVDGGQRTEAQFSVANVGRQFLTIRLPQRAELWSLSVSGRQVKPQRSAAGDYEVSLGQLGRPVPVKVVYACRPAQADLERIELGRIELPGVQINQTGWTIIPPPGYRVTAQQTKMQTHDLAQEPPAYLKLYRLLAEDVFTGSLLMPSLGKARHPIILAEVLSARASYEFPAVQAMPGKPVEMYDYDAARVQPPPSDQPAKAKAEQVTQEDLGIRLLAEGRFTLPVDLVPTAGAGLPAAFTGLGTTELTIGLTRTAWMSSCWAVGFTLIAAVGIALVRRCGKSKAVLIVAVLALASLLAVWRPGTVHFANGAFTAALCLIPFYVLTALVRLLLPKLHLNGSVSPASAIVGAFLVSVLFLGCSAHAAVPAPPIQPEPPKAAGPLPVGPLGPAPVKERQPVQPPDTKDLSPVIIPYDGDPTAPEDSNKVLISYARFIELWNLAHPNDAIDGPRPGTDVSLAAVCYSVTVEGEQLSLLLTADVRTYGRDWVVLPMPLSGLAVTEATFAGKPAQLHSAPQTEGKQAAPGNMVLMLPGRAAGQLQIKALAKPEYFGRRGSAKLSLPPLPGAVMDVLLPQDDLELEVDQIETVPSPRKTNGAVKWVVPLGMTRELTLRWLPKAGGGAADRTLSAAAAHDVYAFHWAIVGVSRITYTFSGGEHDRFSLLVPKGATLTEVKGTNIRDFRDLGQRTVDDCQFSLVEVRLHRPAKKQYDLTVRWLGDLPASDTPGRLLLVRADDVSRESGTVTLHSAGGMALKVAQVAGGRRTDIPTAQTSTDAGLTADRATPVAAYYWPYRPFALSVQLSRLAVSPKVHLDQLVRVSSDATELLVQAKLTADQGKLAGPGAGKLFSASFTLPAGYELLSVVGPAVEGFYERSSDAGRFLHVKFNRGQQETKIALVLVRKDVRLEAFDVPLVAYIDAGGSSSQAPEAAQQGRLAVQVAASLDAKTVDSKSLKAIVPATLKDWLDANQINAVQFAYSYEQANPSLRLDIRPQPTRVRVEVFAGLAVKTTAAVYTYRLRYNIAGSPIDNLTFSLPDEYASLVAVNSPALRSVTQAASADGWTSWKVILVNEVTGDVDIAVNFALPIDASTKLLSVPRIRTDAPAGYRAVIAVQNMSRHDISVTDSTKLTELAVSEQQKLMSTQMTESLQYVFQSFEDNWSLALGFTPAKAAARIQAVVDLLALTTVIDRNGRCRYEARLSLQNRSEQFLRVEVPHGLRLWSATVASQPVKPVTAADSAPGPVLIPLVKTSPGGLPYDVYLYFADEQAEPLIEPLNGIARLKPPAVSIADVPVMRTTWSLLLPAGYRYMRPDGNMSPVAGTVEILSLDIDARLDQLKRLEKTYRDVAGSASRSEVVAQQNLRLFNQKLNADIQQAQSFLEANRDQVADEDYRRLSSKLGGQRQSQDVLFGDNSAYIRQQEEHARYDLNLFLNNDDTVNAGVSEIVRNSALLQKPDFISQGEQQQIARLTKELEVSQKQLTAIQQQADKASTEGVIALDAEVAKKAATDDFGTVADDLLLARSDEKADVSKLLGDLAGRSADQLDRKQAQLKSQLEQLRDNRSERYFQGPGQMAQTFEPMDQFQTQAPAQQQAGRSRRMETAGAGGAPGMYYPAVPAVPVRPRAGDVIRQGERGKSEMEARAATGYGLAMADAGFRPAEPQPPQAAAPGSGVVAGPAAVPENLDQYQYVAKGTYSLPVALPQGEVRLDFARSAGEAQLSIWAVPLATIRNLQATAAVVVALLIVLGIIKIWPATPAPISAKRAIIYLVLFLTLTLSLGLLGLLLSLLAIFAVEAIRAASLRKTLEPAVP